MIADCDGQIEQQLVRFEDRADVKAQPLPPPKVRRKKAFSNEPNFNEHLHRIPGVALTAVPGMNALTLLAEVDLICRNSAAPRPSHPGGGSALTMTSGGGKVVSVRARRVKNRRMAAHASFKSQSWLGDFFRRMGARRRAPRAITGAAHKLARIVNRADHS